MPIEWTPANARANAILDKAGPRRPIVALFTGNGNTAKLYPPDLTAKVIEGLREAGMNVIVTSGPGETTLAREALALLPSPVPYLPDAKVATLAALYRKAQLYVGVDSSPKHVAVACGLPTVTIFGLGRAENWNDPRNPRNVVITPRGVPAGCDLGEFERGGYMRKIPPHTVVEAAMKLMNE